MEKVLLNNGLEIPILGLGTWKTESEVGYNSIIEAIKIGYRHIDTAMLYGNEIEVGKAIKDSNVPREEIFLTTKLWNTDQGYESTKSAILKSLESLDVDYIDLYLIHWYKGIEKTKGSWKAMEEFYKTGKIKAIGISNFSMYHIEKLLEIAEVKPVMNQVELHVGLPQYDLQDYCESKGIKLTAYSPLQHGKVFKSEILEKIAKKHNKSIANIALKALTERSIIVIPKSTNIERLISNKEIFDFKLDDEDRKNIKKLWDGMRISADPDNCYF
jgi:methylglyoxal/glyoxal reductase